MYDATPSRCFLALAWSCAFLLTWTPLGCSDSDDSAATSQGDTVPAADGRTSTDSTTGADSSPTDTGNVTEDTGPTPTDEGPAPTDEGPAPTDEGPAPTDEGPAPTDEGPAPTDEGPAPTDEGPVPADEGPAPTDEGPAPTDEGPAPTDEGPAPTDEGPVPTDEGPAPTDEGPVPFEDTAEADTAPEAPCNATVTITQPGPNSFFAKGSPIQLSASLITDDAPEGYVVRWETDEGLILGTSAPDETFLPVDLDKGEWSIVARALLGNVACEQADTVPIIVCASQVLQNFDQSLDPAEWKVFGDAYWDSAGWLEMTGVSQGKNGAIYNVLEYIEQGNVSIRFSIQTGGGSNPGADGFAMTIVETDSIPDLEWVITNADTGGGLGYGVGGNYGSWDGNAFTTEIDTWHNQYNGTTQKHTDPTPDDHLAITADCDPGNHLTWFSVPDVEDLVWHTVRVDILGTHVTIHYDGDVKIDTEVPDLDFRGGWVVFTGSTGFYTNYHRFDNLEILHACK